MAFGVFRQYYFTHPPFAGIGSVSEIGVLSVVSLVQNPEQSISATLIPLEGSGSSHDALPITFLESAFE